MSKGNPILKARFNEELVREIEEDLVRWNQHTRGEPLDLSAWLREAARQLLAKRRRSRAPRPAWGRAHSRVELD